MVAHTPNRQRLLAFLILGLCYFPEVTVAETLEARGDLQWRRGNMHTHSHWSDGDDYLEMIGLWYRERGYDFLVFSDHNVLANRERWIDVEKSKGGMVAFEKLKARFPEQTKTRRIANETRAEEQTGESEKPPERLQVRLSTFADVSKRLNQPGEYLLIQGEEISDHFEKLPIHMNVSNVAELIEPAGGRSVLEAMQANVRAAYEQRRATGQPMIIHLNHPNYGYAVTAEDLARVVGEQFFEVYNGHPGVNNSGDKQHANVERLWDIVLTLRLDQLKLPLMYGLATDDGHEYHHVPSRRSEPGRGWVMVLSEELTAETLIESLEAGRFYASSGVTLQRVETTEKTFAVEVDAVEGENYTIDFIGTRMGYDAASKPVVDAEGKEIHATHKYSDEVGETLASIEGTSAEYEFHGDEIYVRARVTSSKLHSNPSEIGDFEQAWCQPVIGPAAAKVDE
ncbi:CehA/McbA family metallohydrolase domain-containing protein [Adhaeretor mobilis]|uniref:PHP domain protein n=1 Tax=Adhaeretor mobilis TaxID=1930276 RepID=A0A517MSS1_9BACT|nr:hypothetical protein [Adhaeretor mobilis]QDS97935.1 hypothetical protein HG15A2_12030 [Adhaeretor mobilis]